ncbi:hypothetical protein ACS0TY_009723 [Phlomoides rotata]
MKPVRKGLYLTIAVDEGLHKQGVLELRDSLIGRVTHARGDKPLGQAELIKKLSDIWGVRTPWSLIPIGEGYYNFQFSCGDDKERIFAKRTWQIKPGLLRLQRWVQDFNPYKVSSSVAQVWICISELPLEYWNTNIITALASAVGTIIKLDERTASRSMGHFARVLVELDLKQDREKYVMFERAAPLEPRVGSKCDPPTGGTKQWVQRTFGGPKPSDMIDNSAAPNAPCSNSFGALSEEGLVADTSTLADQNNSADKSGHIITECATEGLVSIQGLEVHLPTIVDTLDLGCGSTNSSNDQTLVISQSMEPQSEVQATSTDGFEQVSGQRGKRGRGRAPAISKDYNLRNRTQGTDGSQGETTYVPGPGLIISEDNSTRPL